MKPTSLAAALALSLLVAPGVQASDGPLVVKESPHSVAATMDKLAAALQAKGLKPALRIDHAAAAKAAGLEMAPAQVMLFGNPKLGTPLMQADPRIAIDLPMRVVSWQDKAGKVWIGYADPATLKARYGIAGKDEAFKTMAGALKSFTDSAIAK